MNCIRKHFCSFFSLNKFLFKILVRVLSTFLRKHIPSDGPLSLLQGSGARELHIVLLSYYRILRSCSSLVNELIWPVSLLAKHFDPQAQPDRGIRWLAIRCFVSQSGMSERQLLELETTSLGEHAKDDCQVYHGEEVDGTPKRGGWLAASYSRGEEGTRA